MPNDRASASPHDKPVKDPARQGARHKARIRAVEIIFEAEAKNAALDEVMHERDDLAHVDDSIKPITTYARTLIDYAIDHQNDIDQLIEDNLEGWKLSRLPAVDRAILRIAVAEMMSGDDVPDGIVIDEAVTISRTLSTDDSPNFINGVLGHIQELMSQARTFPQTDSP